MRTSRLRRMALVARSHIINEHFINFMQATGTIRRSLSLTKLSALYLDSTRVTDSGVTELQKVLPRVQIFR
jgi:hypothetical protein